MPNEQVQLIPLEAIVVNANTRKTVDQTALAELAESIRAHGVQSPIVVRNADMSVYAGHIEPADAQLLEVVVGHRRYAACRRLGLDSIPAIVRDLDDDQVRELQVVENLQRQDIHPLDEADAYADLIKACVGPVNFDPSNAPAYIQAVAAKVAKPIEYVTRRLKLRNLIEYSRTAFLEGLITLDHALLLAKLGATEQEKVLRHTLDRYVTTKPKTEQVLADAIADSAEEKKDGGLWEPTSVANTKEFIERELKLELKKAPWDLADAVLVESAGACTDCQSNTAANTALFGDLAIEDATCTDSVCFNVKRDAFVNIQLKAAEQAQRGAALKLSWKFTSVAPRKASGRNGTRWTGAAKWEDGFAAEQVFKQGQWVEAKKGSCEHVTTGVTVDFEDTGMYSNKTPKKPGTKLLVCVAAKCKAHKKEWEKPKSSNNNGSSRYDAKAEAAKQEKLEADAKRESAIRFELASKAIQGIKATAPQLIRQFILDELRFVNAETKKLCGFDCVEVLKNSPIDSTKFTQALAADMLRRHVSVSYYSMEPARLKHDRDDFIGAMKLIGADVGDAFKEQKQAPSPSASPAKKAAKKGGRK
jgi:ParB/RepB/Spo0J family partition protein